jgi:hypothetical protein
MGIQKWRHKLGGAVGVDEKAAFLDLMRRMLSFRPGDRPTVDEVLASEWMVKWALPDYTRSLSLLEGWYNSRIFLANISTTLIFEFRTQILPSLCHDFKRP